MMSKLFKYILPVLMVLLLMTVMRKHINWKSFGKLIRL
jgi:hypothetical protein